VDEASIFSQFGGENDLEQKVVSLFFTSGDTSRFTFSSCLFTGEFNCLKVDPTIFSNDYSSKQSFLEVCDKRLVTVPVPISISRVG